MAEEEKQSEPVTDKNELQKLKVLPLNWVVFLLVTAHNPSIYYSVVLPPLARKTSPKYLFP